ncbi:hypothetical protein CAC42_1763 [Sphaceloma murrayae]|uniref:Uncharacterized protein n=1 Tax=Sphaceloma murrayae TaxID=2082308 RepID=A0A2K1QIF8_9PEZI|nr:hypothetical protein CAC42_1763 [Sphaceloma murrayae]
MSPSTEKPTHLAQDTRTLIFDFKWCNFKTRILDAANPEGQPLYIADFKFWSIRPQIFLKTGDGKDVISSSKLHNVDINADIKLRGRDFKVEAARRLRTHYVYPSMAFARKPGVPVTMSWTTTWTLKYWNFNLLDEDKICVARYSVDCWALKQYAKLEIMGPKAHEDAVIEEVLSTAFTVYCEMLFRSNNILNLIGSALHKKPGQITQAEAKAAAEEDYHGEWQQEKRRDSSMPSQASLELSPVSNVRHRG